MKSLNSKYSRKTFDILLFLIVKLIYEFLVAIY